MFNFPLPLRSRSHLYRNPHRFHTSNFILLVLRWFYFILRTPPLKYFPCICTLPQSDFFLFSLSAFPRHSSTFLLVTIHLHLILLLPSLSLFSIPFPINNKALLFLSLVSVTMFRLRCFGYTSPFPTPRNRSRYLTRTSYLFLPFSSSYISLLTGPLSPFRQISSRRTNRTQSIHPPPLLESLPPITNLHHRSPLLILAHQPPRRCYPYYIYSLFLSSTFYLLRCCKLLVHF